MSISEEITFTPMDREQCVNIIVINDEVIESQEIFLLSISSSDNTVTFTDEIVPAFINDSSSKLNILILATMSN